MNYRHTPVKHEERRHLRKYGQAFHACSGSGVMVATSILWAGPVEVEQWSENTTDPILFVKEDLISVGLGNLISSDRQ